MKRSVRAADMLGGLGGVGVEWLCGQEVQGFWGVRAGREVDEETMMRERRRNCRAEARSRLGVGSRL